jgi:molybdopterin synthase catalytic subunit
MKAVCIVGPSDAGKTTLIERLVDDLTDHGTVVTVKHLDCPPDVDTDGKDTARHRSAGASETYGVTDDGTWFATGDSRTIDGTLADLAPEYDYALLEGYSDVDLPTIALAGREHQGEKLLSAADADAVEVNAAIDAIEGSEPYETLQSLVERATASPASEYAGAIATFTGRVRTKDDPDDVATEYLEFERYDDVADRKLATIREVLTNREGVYEVLLHHRTGVVEAGEDVVYVVVLAGHRAEAFAAVEDGINRLKSEVPLFKREVTVEDDFWSHERN